jgi:DNA-binding NarL/FixJ family response regulator
MRHIAIAAIAVGSVGANIALGAAWQMALLVGAAVLVFGEAMSRLPRRRLPVPASLTPDSERHHPAAFPLTRKEVEVAILIAQGKSNKEIAAQLFNSERTIDNHVQHIYNKLNIDSRAQLALWMHERHLLPTIVDKS